VVLDLFVVVIESVKSGNLNINVFIRWAFVVFLAPVFVGLDDCRGESSYGSLSVHHEEDSGSQESSSSESDEGNFELHLF